jgi:hypothetical protein
MAISRPEPTNPITACQLTRACDAAAVMGRPQEARDAARRARLLNHVRGPASAGVPAGITHSSRVEGIVAAALGRCKVCDPPSPRLLQSVGGLRSRRVYKALQTLPRSRRDAPYAVATAANQKVGADCFNLCRHSESPRGTQGGTHTPNITYKIADLGLLPIGTLIGQVAGFIAGAQNWRGANGAEPIDLDYRPKPYFRPRKLEAIYSVKSKEPAIKCLCGS